MQKALIVVTLLVVSLAGLAGGPTLHGASDVVTPFAYLPLIARDGPTPTSTLRPTATSTATTMPTSTPTTITTPQGLVIYITHFYFDSPTANPRSFSVKALVVRNGIAFDGALVSGTITRGGTTIPVTLASIGNGYYTACYVGSLTGTGPQPSMALVATDSDGNTATATTSTVSSLKFPECP